ncbi:MAG TPA: family 43 glycosylhydrolase, partial [Aquihabitans sp.]|nr:family 43 glycosylhydrolase [Aquihabitans sp.]
MTLPRPARPVRVAAGVAALVALVAACAPSLGQPALRQTPNTAQVFDNSDPDVLVEAGKTYLFGSSNNMKLPVRPISTFSSNATTTQQEWARSPRDAMPTRPAWVDPGEWEIWAPSVVKMGTRFAIYFAAHHKDATTDEANDQCIGRATSSAPMGPYTPEATPVYCGMAAEGPAPGLPASNRFGRGALDPEVFRSADGRFHMVVALSRTADNIGSVSLNSTSGRPVNGLNARPAILARQSLPWHDGTDDGGRGASFLENPSMIYEPQTKTYLLFYSAGHWSTRNYNTGFARCAGPAGPCTLDTRGPFLKTSPTAGAGSRSGPGGLTVFRSASGGLMV